MSVSMAPGPSQAITDGMQHRGWGLNGDRDGDRVARGRLLQHTAEAGDLHFNGAAGPAQRL